METLNPAQINLQGTMLNTIPMTLGYNNSQKTGFVINTLNFKMSTSFIPRLFLNRY